MPHLPDALILPIEADLSGLLADTEQVCAEFEALSEQLCQLGGLECPDLFEGLEQQAEEAEKELTDLEKLSQRIFGILQSTAEQAYEAMGQSLFDFIRSGKINFQNLKEVALSALESIALAILETFKTGILNSLLPSQGSGLAGVLGRARGGPVAPFTPYLVGEQGPELFFPKVGGSVVPIGGMTASAPRQTRIVITVNGVRDGDDLRRSTSQLAEAVRRAVLAGERDR